jgi:hypothetical protein
LDHKSIVDKLDGYREKIEALKNNAEFMAETSRADRLAYHEKVLSRIDSIKYLTDDEDVKQLRRVEMTLELWAGQWNLQPSTSPDKIVETK